MDIAVVVEREDAVRGAPGTSGAVAGCVPLRDAVGLATALRREGHDVEVLTGCPAPVTEPALERAVRTWPRAVAGGAPEEAVPRAREFGAWLREAWSGRRPDVVLATSWQAGAAALVAGGRDRPPVVVRSAAPERGSATASLQQAVLRGADVVLAPSEEERSTLVFSAGVPRRATAVVPTGVDVDAFPEAKPRATSGEDGGPVRVLCAGGPEEQTGVPALVRALRTVPEAHLLVLGVEPGPDERPRVAALHRLAAEAGVAGRVRGLGTLAHDEMPGLLADVDLVAHVPDGPCGGRLVLEAMSVARPVLVSRSGALEDVVAHRTCGMLVPPRDDRALASALRSLVRDPFARQALGQAGRDRVLARYSWARVAADVLRSVHLLLGTGPAPDDAVAVAR